MIKLTGYQNAILLGLQYHRKHVWSGIYVSGDNDCEAYVESRRQQFLNKKNKNRAANKLARKSRQVNR